MVKGSFVLSDLYCTACGTRMSIPRKESLQRETGHVKHMYCPTCKETKAFEERTKDSRKLYWESYHNKEG